MDQGQSRTPLVTLSSDFGQRDPYVASIKGILHRMCTAVIVEDLSHEIAPQDLMEGAVFLAGAAPYFPPETIHVVVVDPGVGTDRRPIVARIAGQSFVCPDNGLLTLMERECGLEGAWQITNPACQLDEVSATFHGRDVFAPTAARLALGMAPAEAGPAVERLVELPIAEPQWVEAGRLKGEIIHVDRFGNLITNIRADHIAGKSVCEIQAGKLALDGLKRTYGQAEQGETLALIGSTGLLEIAVRGESAAGALRMGRGTRVSVGVAAP